MTDTPAHIAFQSLPIVDVSGLTFPDETDRRAVAAALGKAARECGFLYLVGHGVPRELRDRLLGQAKAFFALPFEEKMKVYIGRSENHRGYVPPGEEGFDAQKPDSKEGFDLAIDLPADHPAVTSGTPMCGANQWPDLPSFKADVQAYYDAVMALGRRLARALAMAMEIPEDSFERHVTVPVSQLRLLHYPFDPDLPEDRPGIGAHTDYEIFTILLPTAPGLEVMNGDGQWIDAPPVEDAFVVNIGDMLEVWTNGALVATSHRVRKVKAERYSFPLFFGCDYETVVEPLAPFRRAGEATRYTAICAGEHLWAQTIQSFAYLKRKLAAGELALPDGSLKLSSFGQEAKQGAAAPS
jgi:isopenicillin N synthase-like dioxygenase